MRDEVRMYKDERSPLQNNVIACVQRKKKESKGVNQVFEDLSIILNLSCEGSRTNDTRLAALVLFQSSAFSSFGPIIAAGVVGVVPQMAL